MMAEGGLTSFHQLLNELSGEYEKLAQRADSLKAENDNLKLHGLSRGNSGTVTSLSSGLRSRADGRVRIDAAQPGIFQSCCAEQSTHGLSFDSALERAPGTEPEDQGWSTLDLDGQSPRSPRSTFAMVGSHPMPCLPKLISALSSSQMSSLHDLLDLQPLWTEKVKKPALAQKLMRSKTFATAVNLRVSASKHRGGDALEDQNGWFQRCVLSPSSRRRLFWDAMSVLVLAVDILLVPMTVFALSEDPLMQLLGLTCTLFWTADVPVSLISGFHTEKGLIEMRPRKIWRHYLRTWMLFDVLVISVDWIMIILDTGFGDLVGVLRLGKVARVTRIFRLFRLLRMLKMPEKAEEISDSLHSESLYTTFGVIRSLAGIAVINHFIACGWYGIGTWGTPGWVSQFEQSGADTGIGNTYATALHWSFAQFTPASMEIGPQTLSERIYAILVLLGGLVVFSSFVSSITAAMTQLHTVKKQAAQQAENVRKYIHENKLSLDLGNRIVSFARRAKNSSRKRVHESEIDIFQVLPQSLRMQVHWEVYNEVLKPHPLFSNFYEVGDACLLEICNTAMTELSLSTSQELFTYGQSGMSMYFLWSGELDYFHRSEDKKTDTLTKGQLSSWCSEASLWLKWEHQGRLVAMSHSEFAVLSAHAFRRLCSDWVELHNVCKVYAKKFHEVMQNLDEDIPVDIWDFMMGERGFDTLHDLATEAFQNFSEVPAVPHHLTANSWRPWRTLSLLVLKPPGVAKVKRSKSLP